MHVLRGRRSSWSVAPRTSAAFIRDRRNEEGSINAMVTSAMRLRLDQRATSGRLIRATKINGNDDDDYDDDDSHSTHGSRTIVEPQ